MLPLFKYLSAKSFAKFKDNLIRKNWLWNCMRIILAVIFILAVLTAGCASDGDKSQFEQATGIESQNKTSNAGAINADSFIQSLISKGEENAELKYTFSQEPDLNTLLVAVKGLRIKLDIMSVGHQVPPYSSIYVNRETQEAFGICEARRPVECDPLGKVTVLGFDDVNPLTPHDWLRDIPSAAEVVGTESFDRQETTLIRYQKGNNKVRMWIHDYYNLPMKIELSHIEGEDEIIDAVYVYKIIQSGRIKTSEVTPSK